jgi:hypothetical protein
LQLNVTKGEDYMATPVAITVDFGTVAPWDPTRSGVAYPADGVYACTVKAVNPVSNAKSGKDRYEVELLIDEAGDYTGTGMTAAIFGDFSKDANKAKLKAALASIGMPIEKMQGQKTFDLAATLVDKKTTVLVRTPEGVDGQGRPKLPDILWIPQSQVDTVRAQFAGAPPKAAAAAAVPAAKASPANLFD